MVRDKNQTIVITGGSGLLGLNWGLYSKSNYAPVLGIHDRKILPGNTNTREINLDSVDEIIKAIENLSPASIIHTAGLTSIESCEKDPELANYINVELSSNVAKACKSLNIPMVHISTDNFVDSKYPNSTENDPVKPVNKYAQTKWEAEQTILQEYDDVVVVRTNFYGWGPNYRQSFSDFIINNLRAHKDLHLFEDVYYTPILMTDLIEVTHKILEECHRGVFNIVSDQRLSKYEFGKLLANEFKLDDSLIKKSKLCDANNLVRRPFDMSMSNNKVRNLLGREISSLKDQIATLKKQENSKTTKEIQAIDSIR